MECQIGYAVLIGSYARGDNDLFSDCDVLLINIEECNFDVTKLPIQNKLLINYVSYDQKTFNRLYEIGSLFLYHALNEGILIEGNAINWCVLKNNFKVQKNFQTELFEIWQTTELLSKTFIFGGKYLTPLVNSFTELKNACIFSLAHQGIYEFNKNKCFDLSLKLIQGRSRFKELKAFYDFSVREINLELPFDPNLHKVSTLLLLDTNQIVKDMYYACK